MKTMSKKGYDDKSWLFLKVLFMFNTFLNAKQFWKRWDKVKIGHGKKDFNGQSFLSKKRSELNPFCLLTLLSRSSFCFAKQMLPNKLKWVIKMQSAHSIDAIINNFPVTRDRITWFVDQSSQTTQSIGKKLRFYLMRFFTIDVLSNLFLI